MRETVNSNIQEIQVLKTQFSDALNSLKEQESEDSWLLYQRQGQEITLKEEEGALIFTTTELGIDSSHGEEEYVGNCQQVVVEMGDGKLKIRVGQAEGRRLVAEFSHWWLREPEEVKTGRKIDFDCILPGTIGAAESQKREVTGEEQAKFLAVLTNIINSYLEQKYPSEKEEEVSVSAAELKRGCLSLFFPRILIGGPDRE